MIFLGCWVTGDLPIIELACALILLAASSATCVLVCCTLPSADGPKSSA